MKNPAGDDAKTIQPIPLPVRPDRKQTAPVDHAEASESRDPGQPGQRVQDAGMRWRNAADEPEYHRKNHSHVDRLRPAVGVERATILVGPPLILTSAVLACGLAMTVLSGLPSLRLFGWLSAFAMVAALFADLFMLRPIAMFLSQLVRRMSHHSLLRSTK